VKHSPESYRSTYLAEAQPHVPEPILAVGLVSTAGAVSGMVGDAVAAKAMWTVSPLAAAVFRKKQAKQREETVTTQLVAVTATNIYFFAHPRDAKRFTVTAAPMVLARSGVRASVEAPGRMSQRLHLALATGEQLQFDIHRGPGAWAGFSEPMRDLLLQPVGV